MLEFIPAGPQDTQPLLDLIYHQAASAIKPTLDLVQMTWEDFGERFRDTGQVYRICSQGELAGLFWIEQREDILHLHGLILLPAFQGRGFGRRVLEHLAARYCGQARAIELGVHESNAPARKLYERCGFEVVRYRPEVGFYILQKPL
jgi:ribosomal protein S18 acetylase RimI-like enzyme